MSSGVEGKDVDVLDLQERARFEQLVLPHLDAAFNLARWILRGRADAEDVAQEAMLRDFSAFFAGFMAAMFAPGSCRSCAITATRGWRRIGRWN